MALMDARGKEILVEFENSIKKEMGVSPIDIANVMAAHEVCDDIREIIGQIMEICET